MPLPYLTLVLRANTLCLLLCWMLVSSLTAQSFRWTSSLMVYGEKAVGSPKTTFAEFNSGRRFIAYTPDRLSPPTPSLGLQGQIDYRLRPHWSVGLGGGFTVDPSRASNYLPRETYYAHWTFPLHAALTYHLMPEKAINIEIRGRAGYHFHWHDEVRSNDGTPLWASRGGRLAGMDLAFYFDRSIRRPGLHLGYTYRRYRHTYHMPPELLFGLKQGFAIDVYPHQHSLRIGFSLQL